MMLTQRETKLEPRGFETALSEWLSGDVTGHLGAYMYADDCDDHRWETGHSASSYYFSRDERGSLEQVLGTIDATADNFIDLGPGGEASVLSKSLPLMRELNSHNYYPADLSMTFANKALSTMQAVLGVEGRVVITDFFNCLPIRKTNAIIAIMGGTIGNFETHTDVRKLRGRLSQILHAHRKAVEGNSYLLVSIDANDNGKEIMDCYDSPQFDELIRGCLDRAIDTSDFDYDVVWTPDNFQLAIGLRSNRDQTLFFDECEFDIEMGTFLPVLNSYRFPVEFFKEAAAQSGWQHQKTWTATGRVHYMLFATQEIGSACDLP